jgi:hypothetical protein
MSDNTLNFERKEFRSVIKYLFVKGLSGKEIFADMVKTLGDQCRSYATINNWVAEFKRGRSDVKDEHRSGRPISVTTPGDIDSGHDMIQKIDEQRRDNSVRFLGTGQNYYGSIL